MPAVWVGWSKGASKGALHVNWYMDVDMDMDMDMGHGHGPWHVASRCVGPDLGRSTEAVAAISLKVN